VILLFFFNEPVSIRSTAKITEDPWQRTQQIK
jgi:hypothetical protein